MVSNLFYFTTGFCRESDPLQLPWSVSCFTLPLAAVGSCNLLYHCFLYWLWVAATVTVVCKRFTLPLDSEGWITVATQWTASCYCLLEVI